MAKPEFFFTTISNKYETLGHSNEFANHIHHLDLEINDFPGGSETFEEILDYIYLEKPKISINNALKLYSAAHYLQIKDLKEICVSFIKEKMKESPLNVVKNTLDLLCQAVECFKINEETQLYVRILEKFVGNFTFLEQDPNLDLKEEIFQRDRTGLLFFKIVHGSFLHTTHSLENNLIKLVSEFMHFISNDSELTVSKKEVEELYANVILMY